MAEVMAAVAALRERGGSYLTRHAERIALRAVLADSDTDAAEYVRRMVGHTSVGRRNADAWATLARDAARTAVHDEQA
jgi:hypothetical protein